MGFKKYAFGLFMVFSTICFSQEIRKEDEVVVVSKDDQEMKAAILKAKKGLDDFLVLAKKPEKGMSDFELKVRLEENGEGEHLWVTDFSFLGEKFKGKLANDPEVITKVKGGQVISFNRSQISDWGYLKNGRQVGRSTVCVMLRRIPKSQADYYRDKYKFDC